MPQFIYLTGCGYYMAPSFAAIVERPESPAPAEDCGSEALSSRIEDEPEEASQGLKGLKRHSRAVRLACLAIREALRMASIPVDPADGKRNDIGVVVGTNDANLEAIDRLQQEAETYGVNNTNPGLFPETVLNVTAGQASIYFGLGGPNVTISGGDFSSVKSLQYAADMLESGSASHVAVCIVRLLPPAVFEGSIRYVTARESVVALVLSRQPSGENSFKLRMASAADLPDAAGIRMTDEGLPAALAFKLESGGLPSGASVMYADAGPEGLLAIEC
ncbi:beta-ketoacyl synthase N-terminal-like domain-containing protein [Paenibacillus sp. UNC499MF]|uniref:beta-ketoacyl synthase N-terminal-like domain-containing protein n=1 Tax=Paenibacillus sp. UNC499MF TaxID=1502751 RepID=UPI00089FE899|nr:beta-ketoacyl synthase N-terminal-like domain-containing protein [Paenibacillus sp. UNC499MF]SEF87234.1 Beta-ketoacyl synthase, N-terminal domain [Paenibacillus sp. UNC499MF]